MMMGIGLVWMIFLIALPVIVFSALMVWLISASKKQEPNNTIRIILIGSILLVILIGLLLGLVLLNQLFGWFHFGPGWMMGSRFNTWGNSSGMMYQAWPGNGMHGLIIGCGTFRRSTYEILTIEETKGAVQDFLSAYGNSDLMITEIMVFDNHGYAVISERSTGVGAFELLIDPVNKTVYPEYGPNMMWNLKYGMHSGSGRMRGGMMKGWRTNRQQFREVEAEMPIDPEEALLITQKYLDKNFPGATVSDHLTNFYGYYTIDVAMDDAIFGMLSVNGYTGRVFYHHWHGAFIEMSDHP